MKNVAFSEYVTGTTFALTLARSHIEALKAVIEGDSVNMLTLPRFVPAAHGLIRRGLIQHFAEDVPKEHADHAWLKKRYGYAPTEAGRLTYKLLVEAGLIIPPVQGPPAPPEVHEPKLVLRLKPRVSVRAATGGDHG